MWVGTWPFCGASLGSYLGFEDFSPIRFRFQGWIHPTTLHRMVWLVCLLTEERSDFSGLEKCRLFF